jgi:hypothetical protein
MARCMTLVFLLALAAASASKVEVTPVQKVIQLMEGMLEKGKKAICSRLISWLNVVILIWL